VPVVGRVQPAVRLTMLQRVKARLRSLWGRPRPVLVHAHMFKNAGSTLDWSLARSFGKGFVDHREDRGMKQGAAYFGPWLQANPDCNTRIASSLRGPL